MVSRAGHSHMLLQKLSDSGERERGKEHRAVAFNYLGRYGLLIHFEHCSSRVDADMWDFGTGFSLLLVQTNIKQGPKADKL